ncbi:hypothetical protein D9611_008406 [Ephemerocybe angulata]|uniref:Uncharacterized protein n=1 Tax=Ephemerocybe angulata TaxID=980116 RepID=A0A8H5BJH1_9AGAR|nr:hypothetical protein D9611_008406 [Tulosesus angulatus]
MNPAHPGSYNFLAKKTPAYPKAGGRIIFPPDESNPRPPSHVPLRPMSLSHTSYPPFTGAPAPPGNFHEESQALLGPRQGDKREYRQAKPEYYRPPTGDMRYPPQGKSNAPSTPLRSPAPNYPTSYRPPLAPTRPQHQNPRLPSTQAMQPSQSYQHMYPSPVRQQGSYQSSKGGRVPA